MPFAPKIRKDVLSALDKKIIPALREQRCTQILAEPPFDFGGVEYKVMRKEWLENKEFAPLQSLISWEDGGISSTKWPTIMFVYAGICCEPIGITQKMAKSLDEDQKNTLGGINWLTLRAPFTLYLPPFALRSGGGGTLSKPFVQNGRILYYRANGEDIRLSLNIRASNGGSATHHLEIDDPKLSQLLRRIIAEMQMGNPEDAQFTHLSFALLLRQYLSRYRASVGNSSYVTPPALLPEAEKVLSLANIALCQNVTEYIVNHLHAKLSLKNLAERFGISTVHLNYIFKQARGTTVMRFVTQMRVEAAKPIVADNLERFADVSQLVGFASEDSFYNAFRRHTGMSPRQYKREFNQKKD